MTPIEIGLTVAVVVLAALQIVAWIDGCNHHIKLYRGQTDLAQLIRKVNETIGIVDDTVGICGKHVDAIGEEVIKQKREVSQVIKLFSASETKRQAKLDELQAALQELASKHLPVHASHDLLTELERQIGEVTGRVKCLEAGEKFDVTAHKQLFDQVQALDIAINGNPAENLNRGLLNRHASLFQVHSELEDTVLGTLVDSYGLREGGHDQRLEALEKAVAGMQVSREVLTDAPGFCLDMQGKPFPKQPKTWTVEALAELARKHVRPEAFADAAHAACPDPRWKSDCEPAVVADEDDQVTTLGEPTFVTVDERTET